MLEEHIIPPSPTQNKHWIRDFPSPNFYTNFVPIVQFPVYMVVVWCNIPVRDETGGMGGIYSR